MHPLTMENIADAAIAAGLADREETDRLVGELYRIAADPATVVGLPRIVQASGQRPDTAPAARGGR